MLDYADTTSPRYQLPFDQLPRGFVPWPKASLDLLEQLEAQKGFRFAEEFRERTLTLKTLRYFYDGLHVAYRPAVGGIDVIAVGWQDAIAYLKDSTVKVVQA